MTNHVENTELKDSAEVLEDVGMGFQELAVRVWESFFQPWTGYQLTIVVGLFTLCYLASKRIEPPLERWLRNVKVNPGFLRVFASFLRRMEWVMFVPLCWGAYQIALANTWPWNTYILRLAFNLAAAWLIISVLSRIIHSRQLSRMFAVIGWIAAALSITGYLEPTIETLDALGFNIGDVRISIWLAIKTIALLLGLTWLATNTGNYVETRVKTLSDLTPSLQVLIGKFVKIFLVCMAIVIALNSVGIDLTALAVFSGAVGVGLGFGLQKVVSNFISGVIILLDKSIKPGDTISLGETFGWIRELRSRFVSVVTRDGREFLIPNEDFITEKVINWSFTDKLVRLDVEFGVAYDSNPHEIMAMVIEATKNVERVTHHKEPVCWLKEFGDSSLNFVVRFWISDPQNGLTNIRGLVMLALWDVFQENKVAIPYPHREIIMHPPQTEAGRKEFTEALSEVSERKK